MWKEFGVIPTENHFLVILLGMRQAYHRRLSF
jgi:hypothetical protein